MGKSIRHKCVNKTNPIVTMVTFQMLGEWYLTAHTNYSTLSVLGNILNITSGPAESLLIQHADFEDEDSYVNLRRKKRCSLKLSKSLEPVYEKPWLICALSSMHTDQCIIHYLDGIYRPACV